MKLIKLSSHKSGKFHIYRSLPSSYCSITSCDIDFIETFEMEVLDYSKLSESQICKHCLKKNLKCI